MATFDSEKATVKQIFVRRTYADGRDCYFRQPYNLVRYDDNSGEYIEPVYTPILDVKMDRDVYTLNRREDVLILDKPPFSEVWEMY